MTTATVTMWVITAFLFVVAWRRRDESLNQSIKIAWETTKRNAALLIVAFIIVGFVNVLSPTELVKSWIGPSSGWRGLILAEVIGMLLPGGPYVVFPLIAVLYQAGAGLGPVIAITTSWATQALLTITFELPFMGWRFTMIRWGLGLVVPLFAGAVAHFLL
ncbi:MAG: permease [Chloroflexi bacterium]|nr:permease [Chloroflexota bacterium]